MAETTLEILRYVCGLNLFISILARIYENTKLAQIFYNFMNKHMLISIIHIVLSAAGIIDCLIYLIFK